MNSIPLSEEMPECHKLKPDLNDMPSLSLISDFITPVAAPHAILIPSMDEGSMR